MERMKERTWRGRAAARAQGSKEENTFVEDDFVTPSLRRALEHLPQAGEEDESVKPYPLLTEERGEVAWDTSLDKDVNMPPAPPREPTPEDRKAREYKQHMAKMQMEALEQRKRDKYANRLVPMDMSDDIRVIQKRGRPEDQKVWTDEEELEFINCIPGMDATVLAKDARADYPSIRKRFIETYDLESMWDPTCAVDPTLFANPKSRYFNKLIEFELEHLGDWLDENDGRFIEDDMELEIESTLESDFSGLNDNGDEESSSSKPSWSQGAKKPLEEAEEVEDDTSSGSESVEE